MKTLKFENKLVRSILSGTKDTTWRFFDDKNLTVGDELVLINSDFEEEFAKAKIISLYEKKFKDIEINDQNGHEKYEDFYKMIEIYQKYYGDRVTGDSLVKIIKFKLL